MRNFRFKLLILFVMLAMFSCSKKEDAKPTSSVLFYAKSTANIAQYADVEFNGTIVGRLTGRLTTEPNCTDAPSSRLIKVTNVEIGVEHKYQFIYSDGTTNNATFTIPATIQSTQCWTIFAF